MNKTKVVMLLAGLVAMGAQAATFDWGASELHDTGGPLDDGAGWALNGVDTFLYYGGVGGSSSFTDIKYNEVTGMLSIPTGAAEGTIVDSYITAGDDYNVWGNFNVTIPGVGLDWLGDISATWEDMNLREFTIITISDADGDYSDGAMWNFITLPAAGFSTATGSSSIGAITAGSFEASGAGALIVIPEPATLGLMGVAGLGMFLARKKARR